MTAILIEYPSPDIAAQRRAAFENAIVIGNRITASITSGYADVEMRSWPAQEAEARAVLAGDELPEGAILPQLAADKNVSVAEYARGVIDKATAFRQIAVAAVRLRRGAEKLLSPDLDTPEAIAAATALLRADALATAAALGITA